MSRITEYIVKYSPLNNTTDGVVTTSVCGTADGGGFYVMMGLTTGAQYSVQVAAHNRDHQTGPFGDAVIGITIIYHYMTLKIN